MSRTLAEQIGVEKVKDGEYVSKVLPVKMGNSLPIAYGGCTVGVAVNAACATVSSSLALYSVLGHFLGPASTEEKLHCHVENVRDTRSFATRRVRVNQKQRDGKFRTCLELTADFHVKEESPFIYSAPPTTTYARPEDCPTIPDLASILTKRGDISEKRAQGFLKMFGVALEHFESRYCTNGVAGQNLGGAAKTLSTTQEHLPISAKTSAEWQKTNVQLEGVNNNMAALAFLMDGALSFLPLSHGHLWFEDVAACSTLDFAFRIFTPDIDLNSWHLRERTTSRGGAGRTCSEGRLWDDKGNLVASTSQQSIMRLQKDIKPSL